MLSENIAQMKWDSDYQLVVTNRLLAKDIAVVMGGGQFEPIQNLVPPNPRQTREQSVEEMEMTLLQWSKEG